MAERIDNDSVLKLQEQIIKSIACSNMQFHISSYDYTRIVGGGNRYEIRGTTRCAFIDFGMSVPDGLLRVSFNVPLPTIKEEPEDPSKPKRFKLDVDVYNIHNVADAERLLRLAFQGMSSHGLVCVEGIEAQK